MTTRIRPLGDLEKFFALCYREYGAFNICAIYTLSPPATLSHLKSAVECLQESCSNLQVGIEIDDATKSFWFVNNPGLKTQIEQISIPSHCIGSELSEEEEEKYVLQVADQLIAGTFDICSDESSTDAILEEKAVKNQRLQRDRIFLPWRALLSPTGTYILLVAQHSIIDGRTLDIVGHNLILALNNRGQDVIKSKEFLPPVDEMFGEVGVLKKLKFIVRMFWSLRKETKLGTIVDREKLSTDWRRRSRIYYKVDFSSVELSAFKKKCKDQGFSINSGLLSIVYEALARVDNFGVEGSRAAVYIDMDARTRVRQDIPLKRCSMGVYNVGIELNEEVSYDCWAERGKRIHEKVGLASVEEFQEGIVQAGFLAKHGQKGLGKLANSKDFGRLAFLNISNLCRALEIDRANEMVVRDRKDGIKIEGLVFDDNTKAIGTQLALTVATVGDKMDCLFTAYRPIVQQSQLQHLAENFKELFTQD